MKGYIYRAYLPSGMSYIGQTINLENRKNNHWSHRNDSEPFHVALRVHGKDAFKWDILEKCDTSIANEREMYWIAYYDSFENGFNKDSGGRYSSCKSQTDESNIKRSVSLKGRTKKSKTINLLSAAMQGNSNGKGNSGKQHSIKQNTEHSLKLSGRHRVYHEDGSYHYE